ncbi:MAG: SRPBCC family protein [Odoribacter sp.]
MRNTIQVMICLVVMMFTAGNLQAQMAAAKKIAPAVEKKVILNAPAQKVWDYISEPENYKKFSGVKAFSCEEKALNAKIELTTKADKKRKQHISVIDYDLFKICYFVTSSDYDGDNQWVYTFEVLPKENNKCEFVVSIYHGFDPLSPEFKEGITQEFNDIVAGVSKKFNK